MRIYSSIFFILSLSFASCERCIECSAYKSGQVVINPEEYCGTRQYVDEREADFEKTCELERANNPGTECQCLATK